MGNIIDVNNVNSVDKIKRTPEIIAVEINNIKEQTRRIVIYNAIEIGRRLAEAKELVSHGEWGKWLEESVSYSQRTANNFMRLFEEYGADQINFLGDNLKSQTFANLSYSQAVALLGIPEEERENFVEENHVEDLSTREIEKLVKEKQELKAKYLDIQKRNKEALVNKEMEIENLSIELRKLQNELRAVEEDSSSEEFEKLKSEVERLTKEYDSSLQKVEELNKKLKEKPVEDEEVKKELELLKKKEKAAKFKYVCDEVVKDFNEVLKVLNEVEDPETRQQFKTAFLNLTAEASKKFI